MWWHWQNLNEKRKNGVETIGHPIRHGRAWLHFGDRDGNKPPNRWVRTICAEWVIWSRKLGVGIRTDESDGEITFHIQAVLFSLFVTMEGLGWFLRWMLPTVTKVATWEKPPRSYVVSVDRELSVSFHDEALWWCFWMDSDEWRSDDSKWRRGSFNLLDALLGWHRHAHEILKPARPILIPMPEGVYEGTLAVERRTWKRPRWPWWPCTIQRINREIRVPKGIPFSGKGENDYDCGEDGLYGCGFETRTDEEAIGRFAGRVLEYRRKRGDSPDYGRGVARAAE